MKKIHLVSHVHWDPAWYLPYEQYRITLIPLMKKLLAILEADAGSLQCADLPL